MKIESSPQLAWKPDWDLASEALTGWWNHQSAAVASEPCRGIALGDIPANGESPGRPARPLD